LAPLGTDFSNVYAAGTGADTQFYGWHYPPYFLGLAALLAAMPYALALVLWQGVMFALYLWVTRQILNTGRARAL